jgi:hypothetical protein
LLFFCLFACGLCPASEELSPEELHEALREACGELEQEWVKYILERGADVNHVYEDGATPFLVVMGKRYQYRSEETAAKALKLMQFLLQKGARPDLGDMEGFNAASTALIVPDEEVWSLLKEQLPMERLLAMIGWEDVVPAQMTVDGKTVHTLVPSGCVQVAPDGLEKMIELAGLRPEAVKRSLLFVPAGRENDAPADQKKVLAFIVDPYRETALAEKHRTAPRLLRYEPISGRSYTWLFGDAQYEIGFPNFPRLWASGKADDDDNRDQALALCLDKLSDGTYCLLTLYEASGGGDMDMSVFLKTQLSVR